MDEEALINKVFETRLDVGRQRGKPRLRWMDQLKEDLTALGVINWEGEKRAEDAGARR